VISGDPSHVIFCAHIESVASPDGGLLVTWPELNCSIAR